MNQAVRTLALSGLRERYPEATPKELRRRLADLLLGEDLAARAYGPLEAVEQEE
jgi:Arc/MetJ family transcription regulator